MLLDNTTPKAIYLSLCRYIANADVFFSCLPSGTNKWCFGIKAESEKIARQLDGYFCHWPPFQGPLYKKLSNQDAAAWCDGKYNVIIITQDNKENLLSFQKQSEIFVTKTTAE